MTFALGAITVDMARERHGTLEVTMEVAYWWGDCTCGRWMSSPWYTQVGLQSAWLQHVAEVLGICWSCGEPSDGQPNRAACRACNLMAWADAGRFPRQVRRVNGEFDICPFDEGKQS